MKIVEIMKALSDENRIRIVNLLLQGELCVCEIETILGLSQTNASRHLAKLKTAGIVEIRKEYQWVYYKIREKFIVENKPLFEYLISELNEDQICSADCRKLKTFKELGFNCEKIKTGKMEVIKKISI